MFICVEIYLDKTIYGDDSMSKKILCSGVVLIVLLSGVVLKMATSQYEDYKRIDSFLDVTITNIQGDEKWNMSQKDIESKYKEFVGIKKSITLESFPEIHIAFQGPFIIRQIPKDYMPIYIEIHNTSPEPLFVNAIKIYYTQHLQIDIGKELRNDTLHFVGRLPSELFYDIKAGDILEFPITVYLEYNNEEIIANVKTAAFFGHSLTVEPLYSFAEPVGCFYAGDQHTHSTYSDGKNTISQLAEQAFLIGFSYLFIADHSQDIDDDQVPPHNSLTWQNIGRECDAVTSILCFRGEEITCDEKRSGGENVTYYLAYDIDLCVGSSSTSPKFEDYAASDDTVFDYVEIQQGGFGVVAHPNHEDLACDSILEVEAPGLGFGIEAFGGTRAFDVWQDRLDHGYFTCGYGNSDAHSIGELGSKWTWVNALDLSKPDILDMLRHGYAAFGNGPFVAFWVKGADKTWYPMGTREIITTWPLELRIQWKSWAEYGQIDNITLVGWNSTPTFLLNPEAEGCGYGGIVDITIEGSEHGFILSRLVAKTSEGREGYTNPIWIRTVKEYKYYLVGIVLCVLVIVLAYVYFKRRQL